MNRLLLLRHAKAVAPLPSEAFDHGRALSERGRADALAMGQKLRGRGLMPERALVSTALRTRETFELLAGRDTDQPDRTLSETMYLADAPTLLEVLRSQSDGARHVMMIGHNPGLHLLALELASFDASLAAGFPTCMAALFSIEGAWSTLSARSTSLLELLRP